MVKHKNITHNPRIRTADAEMTHIHVQNWKEKKNIFPKPIQQSYKAYHFLCTHVATIPSIHLTRL